MHWYAHTPLLNAFWLWRTTGADAVRRTAEYFSRQKTTTYCCWWTESGILLMRRLHLFVIAYYSPRLLGQSDTLIITKGPTNELFCSFTFHDHQRL